MPSVKRSSTTDSRVLRTGTLRIKGQGSLFWFWKVRPVTLTDKALVTPSYKIPLDQITKLERVDVKPYCLLLEASNRRYLLSFESDGDLYDWQEDVYSRSPRIGSGNPFNFSHTVHVGFDGRSGAFSGLPSGWGETLHDSGSTDEKMEQFRQRQQQQQEQHNHHRRDSSQAATLQDTTPSLPYSNPRVKTIPLAEKVAGEPPILAGQYSVKVDGLVVGWRWRARWLTLGPKTLTISKSKNANAGIVLNLRDITKVDRADLRSHCLLLEFKPQKQYFLSFKDDDQLYNWQDTLYSRSPLAGISSPYNFVHHVHVGFDGVTGQFTGVPEQWKSALLPPL